MLPNGFKIAFSMYSKIPMPKTDWTKENMRYAMCFFPLIGIVIGACLYLFWNISLCLHLTTSLFAAIMTLLPLIISGGIHFDGYLDTIDAKNSFQSKEKKLEILKDPHTGAFAIIGGIGYILLTFGLFSELYHTKYMCLVMICYIMSRAFSGLSVVTFKTAKNSGLLKTFSDQSQKTRVRNTMYVYLFLCSFLLLYLHLILGFFCLLIGLLVFLYYKRMSFNEFGGTTGDLAGFFLQIFELSMLLTIVFYEKVVH
ncbi:adenosylcobinamide-GDP ribazoletransferase [Anaeromicropila herbilytica]|uniref:adenosylcobinamide-GDP ribazoletransferase n=1 Tax=Anaeromicropila herbilytica TaxID=2785025 RepID=UPI00232A4F1C|nr:adenosylcobinamide-GDP ribazoletransferase [Anaeromicropila herbilytica]